MNKKTFTVGLDFGTLSCRAVLTDTANGAIAAEESMSYPHGVLEEYLPDGTPLKGSWALQHPGDYTDVLTALVPALLKNAGVDSGAVVGIGIDFTASTVVPLDKAYVPLCLRDAFSSRPHAWVKLWKHHGASSEAEELTKICKEQGRPYLDWYGGRISPECLLAKVLQIYREDREVFDAADCFVEAGDYISSLLDKTLLSEYSALASRSLACPLPRQRHFGAKKDIRMGIFSRRQSRACVIFQRRSSWSIFRIVAADTQGSG